MRVMEIDRATMTDAYRAIRGWLEPCDIRDYARGRIVYDVRAGIVYSYGRHFPLFQWVPGARGRPDVIVLNGDRWGGPQSRTNDHQSIARELAAESGARTIILPWSAIEGAGIDVSSIRPIDVRADTNWTETLPLPAGAPDLDDLASADDFKEDDSRSTVDWQGNPCESHGTWSRAYIWRRDGRQYVRRIYRQSNVWPDGWKLSPSWSEPTSDSCYMDGTGLDRDDDGQWTYDTHHHRLGDALFSAVREIAEPLRPADPFESEGTTARLTTVLRDNDGRAYCTSADSDKHVSGPSGACVHCGLALQARCTWRRRADYLSSFDYNEWPPLYFLAEMPYRHGATTVDMAIDALAPRAVHAAMARGRDVLRQGDVFFIETSLTRAELAARDARFARLSLVTHGAAPRAGEPGYRPGPTAETVRLEKRWARADFRRDFRSIVDRAAAGEGNGRPRTDRGLKKRWRKILSDHDASVSVQRERLRALAFGRPARWIPGARIYRDTSLSQAENDHRALLAAIGETRLRLTALLERGPRDSLGNGHYRDAYRAGYGRNAEGVLNRSRTRAADKYRPAVNRGADYQSAIRQRLAIYGTAHSATEVATVGGSVYARGIVRHVPELEPGRGGERDHRALTLGDRETWYLAVRNTVPRQALRRRRRRTMPAVRAEG